MANEGGVETETQVEEAAEALAKQEGWLSLRHPSPKTQATLRARAAEMLEKLHVS